MVPTQVLEYLWVPKLLLVSPCFLYNLITCGAKVPDPPGTKSSDLGVTQINTTVLPSSTVVKGCGTRCALCNSCYLVPLEMGYNQEFWLFAHSRRGFHDHL